MSDLHAWTAAWETVWESEPAPTGPRRADEQAAAYALWLERRAAEEAADPEAVAAYEASFDLIFDWDR